MIIPTLTPAYGRGYKSKKAVLADWNAGKDFIYNSFGSRWDGKPVNKGDIDVPRVGFRYYHLRKTFMVDPRSGREV